MNTLERGKFLMIFMATLFMLSALTARVYAQVPMAMNYQGYLTDSEGAPINGTVDMTFSLYAVSTGGGALWWEDHSVNVIDGIYSVVLGNTTPLSPSHFVDPLYLGVQVGTDAEMTPRQKITSAAFAINADKLDGQDASAFAVTDHGHSFSDITGTATDGQIPNNITIDYAAAAGTATTANSATTAAYADTAGDSDTVDGQHASAFASTDHYHSFVDITGSATDAQIPNNITINYSASAGNADTVDGQHASAFASSGHTHDSRYYTESECDSRFVNETGDSMTGSSSGGILHVSNSGTGSAITAACVTSGVPAISGSSLGGYGIGVRGYSVNDQGVLGVSASSSHAAVQAENMGGGTGLYAQSLGTGGIGLEAQGPSDGSGYAGFFVGDLVVDTGSTSALAFRLRPDGYNSNPLFAMYDDDNELKFRVVARETSTTEGAELKMYDEDGTNTIELDAEFASDGGGYLALRNGDGVTTITLDSDYSGDGRITTEELQITGGSDLSEQFDIEKLYEDIKPGMVVSIDAARPGKLVVSNEPYDNKVAGIISGAKGLKPGMLMGQKGTDADGAYPVALTGRVYCWANTSNGPIEVGDLLTTSNIPGHAMKATDRNRAFGATIGKAMTPLKDGGGGLVLVLVSLQ